MKSIITYFFLIAFMITGCNKINDFFKVEDTIIVLYNDIEYVDYDKVGNYLTTTWRIEEEIGEEIVIETCTVDDWDNRGRHKANKYINDNQVDFFSWDGYLFCKKTLDLPDYKSESERVEEIQIETSYEKSRLN